MPGEEAAVETHMMVKVMNTFHPPQFEPMHLELGRTTQRLEPGSERPPPSPGQDPEMHPVIAFQMRAWSAGYEPAPAHLIPRGFSLAVHFAYYTVVAQQIIMRDDRLYDHPRVDTQ